MTPKYTVSSLWPALTSSPLTLLPCPRIRSACGSRLRLRKMTSSSAENDDTSFRLDDLKGMNITSAIAERGHEYYIENRVRYICLNGSQGHAIVGDNESYAVEFEYHNGEISHLICDCPCRYNCKHEFAAMLLREMLEINDKHYAEEFERTGYFAAITKGTLFAFAVDSKETGCFTL